MSKCKGIAGNIGTLKASIKLYEHNPFVARPYQNLSYPFNPRVGQQIPKDNKFNVEFLPNGDASLTPLIYNYSTFLAMLKEETSQTSTSSGAFTSKTYQLDIVKGFKASNRVRTQLPGGSLYEQSKKTPWLYKLYDMFPHMLWIQEDSSAFFKTETIPPSEYFTPYSELAKKHSSWDLFKETAQSLLQASSQAQSGSPIWDMNYEENKIKIFGMSIGTELFNTVYPIMISKRLCQTQNPIHWTVRKYTPLYQGQDFAIDFTVDGTSLDEFTPTEEGEELFNKNPMQTPYNYFFQPIHTGDYLTAIDEEFNVALSTANLNLNEPYFVENPKNSSDKNELDAYKTELSEKYLKNKAYIIIELGTGEWTNPAFSTANKKVGHNYFIELVNGRNPRFLCLGRDLSIDKDNTTPYPLYKLRNLSGPTKQFDGISVGELFASGRFRVIVRNYMGSLYIEFCTNDRSYGPWIISRDDNVNDTHKRLISKTVPMVVSNKPLRIHGGNMTVGFNYFPLIYPNSGNVVFPDRQAVISPTMTNKDIYATFAFPGDNDSSNTPSKSRSHRNGFFNDLQLSHLKMGYASDAYQLEEIHQNQGVKVKPYELCPSNYVNSGREWINRPIETVEKPSIARIKVIRNFTQKENNTTITYAPGFNLSGYDENIMGPDGRYIGEWDVAVELVAGSMRLPLIPDDMPKTDLDGNTLSDNKFVLYNCVTPVVNAWSLIVLGGDKVITNTMETDITEFVTNLSDGWTANDYTSIDHAANMKLYLPIATGSSAADEKVAKILSLIDKQFYVTISYWWDEGMGLDQSVQSIRSSSNYQPEDDPRLIQITGMCHGLSLDRQANKVFAQIEIRDGFAALENQFIINSPFFDGVSDVTAVHELLQMAGFDNTYTNEDVPGRQNTNGIDRRPLGFIQTLRDSRQESFQTIVYNEEKHTNMHFNLPGAFAELNKPAMYFNNGMSYRDILDKIVKIPGKTMYFDRYGVFIYELNAAKMAAFKGTKTNPDDPDSPLFHVDIQKLIKAAFVTSPKNKIWDVDSKAFVTFDAQKHTPFIAYNSVKIKRSVADAVNKITIYTAQAPDADKHGRPEGFILRGREFPEQIWNPESEGFFGYRKHAYIANGIYGDLDSALQALRTYARFKFPPLQVDFECFGVPGLKALDVICLDGQPLYITEISHDLNPEQNNWWMTIKAEWLKSYDEKLLLPPIDTVPIYTGTEE